MNKKLSFLVSYLESNPILLVDAGAKGGVFSLGGLNRYCKAFGFEPNPIAYQELEFQKNKKTASPFLSVTHFEQALGETEGLTQFLLAGNPSYNSFLEPDLENYSRHMGQMKGYSNWENNLKTISKINVQVTTLDNLAIAERLPYLDMIKLDTQGSELTILKGAKNLFDNHCIGIIFTEVAFVKVYKNQCLFSDIDMFLRANHFSFVDCRFYPEQVNSLKNFTAGALNELPRFSTGGDAFYLVDFEKVSPQTRAIRALHTGLILAFCGYFSLSKNILDKYADLDTQQIDEVLFFFNRKPKRERILSLFKSWCPPAMLPYFRQIRRFF